MITDISKILFAILILIISIPLMFVLSFYLCYSTWLPQQQKLDETSNLYYEDRATYWSVWKANIIRMYITESWITDVFTSNK